MSLASGTRLGFYEIVGEIGAGGMGDVYRARDTRLDRPVAIKVVRADFSERFEREARSISALNHPHICTLHDVGEHDGTAYLVMEYVEGHPLAGPLPIADVLRYGAQICHALEAAHRKGIVHRDLKPANILVTKNGIKLLDFGLAKPRQPGVAPQAEQATLAALTGAHTIIGTPQYMAPEQIEGHEADARTDIFALGCVLYELITGRRAFDGKTASNVIAAVLATEPRRVTELVPLAPSALEWIVQRCLQKDPDARWQSASDVALQLGWLAEHAADTPGAAPAAPATPSSRLALLWPAAAGVLAIALGGALWNRPGPAASPSARLTITLPLGQELTSYPAITRDGRTIAYTARQGMDDSQLYLRDLTSFEVRAVPGSSGAKQPFFSPDGRWVAFFGQGQILKAEVTGGTPVRIGDAASPLGGTWTDDNTIIYNPSLGAGLLRVPAGGGSPTMVSKPDGGAKGYAHVFPHALPGGRYLGFTVWGQTQGVAMFPLEPGRGDWSLVLPLETSSDGIFASTGGPEGRLFVVTRDADVKAAAFNAVRPVPVSADASVLSGVFFEAETESGPWLAVSNTGTAVYAAASPAKTSLVWVDQQGKTEPLDEGQDLYREVRLSADGSRAVVRHVLELWVHDLERKTHTRLTAPAGSSNIWPSWSRDGKRVIFASNRGGDWDIYSQPADGSAPAEPLLKRRLDQFPLSIAPDGAILYTEIHPETARDLWTLSPDGKTTPVRVSNSNETAGQFRPSTAGAPRWIAYACDESGRYEVYLQSYPSGAHRVPVSSGGGISPHWSSDGKQLFYVSGDSVVAVDVGPDGSLGGARNLFDRSNYHFRFNVNGWDTAPDGKRFLMIHRDPGSVPRQLNVILNWFADLDRVAPLGYR